MARKASPTLIGAFVVTGLALLAAAIVFVAGNDLFKRRERAVMYFRGSIYGLQVGAPVVFRGVRVGSVTSLEVVYDRVNDRFVIPVVAELERDAVRGMDGPRGRTAVASDDAPAPPQACAAKADRYRRRAARSAGSASATARAGRAAPAP